MNSEVIQKLRVPKGGLLRALYVPSGLTIDAQDLPKGVRLAKGKQTVSSVLCFSASLDDLAIRLASAQENLEDNANLTLALPQHIYLQLSPRSDEIRALLASGFRMITHFQLIAGYKAIRFSRRVSQGKTSQIGLAELEQSSRRIRARYAQLA
ncbi:hypothetical protein [uncultured Umboniibacter sp.]|uniref:hypothetical protein n=1 Tax=uncultured Umboniibacter sp. TaxID=1798917 RepID=UPI002636BB28|nr:hypothetical protein [uncultured Umboniibacter sp.]